MADFACPSGLLMPVTGDSCDTEAPSQSSSCNNRHQRVGGQRVRATMLCGLAVAAVVGSALAIAGLADLAASPKGKTSTLVRRLMPRWLQGEDEWMLAGERGASTKRRMGGMRMDTCAFDNQWISTKWSYLSKQEQQAWALLGWTKGVWDQVWGAAQIGVTTTTSTLPPTTTQYGQTTATTTWSSFLPITEDRCWQDLTEDQKDGATALGYTTQRWIDCKKERCQWPTGLPRASASCLTMMKYLESVYNYSTPWFNYTQMKRNNLVLLGWHPEGVSWKTGRTPASYGRPWSELTVREREAAAFLKYDAKLWETCEKATDSPCLLRLEHLETKMRTWVWEEILPGLRERLGDMGWQSRTWFEGETPAVMKAPWLGLTGMQRASARIIGYTQDTFRGCPDATCLDRFAYVQYRWKGIGWMQMKLSERRAWMLLGHSESLWASNNLPGTMQKRWAELTPEQQTEATFLGHSEGTWQGCNMEWSGRNETGDGANGTSLGPLDAVRARFFIDRPYSEISGNVYGKQVATMPTSFIRVLENAVSRALFCGNPPLSLNPNSYLGPDGEPLCVQKTNFEKQKYRVRVLNVVEGSIVVDFFIVANATPQQTTSRLLFEALSRQIEAKLTSPLCHDKYFGRFAKKTVIEENRLSSLKWTEMQTALDFEPKRNAYTSANMCLLHKDAKDNPTCGTAGATGLPRTLRDFAGTFVALLASSLFFSA